MTDGEVVGRVLAGDTEAYAVVVDRYHGQTLRFAMRMLGNKEDAEDVVQDTFLRAYRSLGNYRERGHFKAWLFQILVNRCRTAAAAGNRMNPAETGEIGDVADGEDDHETQVARISHRWELQAAIAALAPAAREAFLLKYVDELTYQEIAASTGTSVSALKMRVSRARDELRRRLRSSVDG